MSNMNASRLVLGVVAALALSACGGSGSSGQDDPERTPVSSCTADTCTGGIFTSVTEGLNYACAAIKARTTTNGYFACPVDETVTFSITHPESSHVVQLGRIVMKNPFAGAADKRLYITARDLAGTATGTTIGNREQNIMALLQALDANTNQTPNQPSDQIVLLESQKLNFLNQLGRSLSAELDLAPAAFADIVNPALLAIGKPVLQDAGTSLAAIDKAVNSVAAGIYYSFAPLSNEGINNLLGITTGLTDTPGFIGQNSSETLLGHLAIAVDRKGRLFGFGEYVKGSNLREAPIKYLDIRNVPAYDLSLAPSGNALLWPLNNNLRGLSFALENGDQISLNQGLVERGAMASNVVQYEEQYLLGTASQAAGKLGQWSATGTIPSGRINLYKHGYIFPAVTPAVWDEVTFPLHLTASVYKSKYETVDGEERLANCTEATCLIKDVPLTLLADGNIVTDTNADCAVTDPETLHDGTVTEQPVGMVNRAFTAADTGGVADALDVSLLFPVNVLATLPGDTRRHVELGTRAAALVQLTDTYGIRVSGSQNSARWFDFFAPYTNDDLTNTTGLVVFSPRCVP